MSEINNYDPNPYDDVTIDEALAQIYDRVNDRTIRQMVTLLKNTAGDTSRYTIEKATAESGEVTYKLMQQISGGTPTPVGDTVDIPTVPIMTIQKNGTGITPVDGTVNITVPVVAADVAALPDNTRYAAALSLTIDSATFVVTGQLKDQNGDNLGIAQTIDLPLESVVVGGSYNSQTQKVVLTLQNGNTIEFSVADLVYGLQTELSETNKLNPAYINYDNTHRAVSDAEKSEWNGKQDAIDSSHKLSADFVDDTNATNKFATAEELEQIQTNKNNILLISENNITKNYFDYYNATIVNTYVASFVNNNDGTFTLKSNNATSGVVVPFISITLKAGQYVLSGCPPIGSDSTYRLDIRSNSGNVIDNSTDYGSGSSTFTIESDGLYRLGFRFGSGYTFPVDGLTFRPMICTPEQWAITHDYQPYIMNNAELTTKELQNKMSFGFSGNPNPAVYVKDWDFVPDGTYLLSYICAQNASTRKGVSVYMFSKYTTNHIILFTPVVEASGATITSCVASGSEGAETITFTMAQRGYHTAAAIQIQAF